MEELCLLNFLEMYSESRSLKPVFAWVFFFANFLSQSSMEFNSVCRESVLGLVIKRHWLNNVKINITTLALL